jgi:hypothetical protein
MVERLTLEEEMVTGFILKMLGKLCNTTIINAFTPNEELKLQGTEKFCDYLIRTYEAALKYDAKIVLGDFNSKIGKEVRSDIAGKYTVHESTSKIGNTLVSFAHMFNLIIVSTKLQHMKIHKGTWVILGTNNINQTDHMLVNRKIIHTITNF